ncbi:hypothetical protein STEG23_034459, partial [Scotinomys teguina]
MYWNQVVGVLSLSLSSYLDCHHINSFSEIPLNFYCSRQTCHVASIGGTNREENSGKRKSESEVGSQTQRKQDVDT